MDKIERIERRLKLHDVRVLMSVVEAGSMHKAAKRLGTSQPAVSRSIADLEHALGVRLLDRSGRGVEATQYGRAIIRRGIAVFDELRQGVRDIEFLADPTAGELRIGYTEAVAGGPGFAVIDRTHAAISAHRVQCRDRSSGGALPQLGGAECRAGAGGGHRPDPGSVCRREPIRRLLVVAAGLRNPWTRRRRIELAELVSEPWTLSPPDTVPGALAVAAFRVNVGLSRHGIGRHLVHQSAQEAAGNRPLLTIVPGSH